MSNQVWQARKQQVIAQGMGNLNPLYVETAKNAEIWDIEGNRYIDFGSGIAVNNTGHLHPRIVEAVKAQLDNFSHTCAMVTPYTSFVELAEQLTARAPGNTAKKAVFLTTGAEAVENAIKVARAHTKRSGVIAFKGGFHGRTNMTMGLTGKVAPYKAGFGPFPGEIYHAPYPNAFHGISIEDSLQAIDDLFACDIEPSRVAAIIFEPVQGEGGFYQAPPAFAQALRELCDKHGILLIADEIQTGFARTGKMFATEYLGIEPDMMTMAKGIAGGFPISALVGKANIMDAAGPGGLGGTYAGSPLGCAAGLEVLKIIDEEQLCEKALKIGEVMTSHFRSLQSDFPVIGEVRNLGAMIAVEFVDPQTGAPMADLTKLLVAQAREEGVILLSCGVKGNVIRFLPALTIEDEILAEGIEKVKKALAALV
ncbi:4-aminobutyrate--2-oxoglutarate transaminase [Photobacterium sp. WH77]|uniref:4-aminobutyrate--2-oxoglutarate transaminase n=1 Tax=unclassified Photobacterium TaxID=2628852 RepID=UPI001EDB5803|nr:MULTISPECIES: 4-aminobutyrate--2-oxoglutarate transaminase [unclassified Photobacterium]MCG2838384.1 4-aminobutyrate--2-oxoglutarate transaminase [Photobacterium sp. WH77]MCG2846001.1 4-aminobutyrate--2-oxoglutarate transaminase [Photobacterium sp. WH80]